MPQTEKPKPAKPANPRTANRAKTTAADEILPIPETSADQPAPLCHIHDKVRDWEVDEVRQNVCVPASDHPLREIEGKHSCLFHLPTKDKDAEKFEEIFQARLDAVDKQCAEIEAEFPDDEKKQKQVKRERNIIYDFRYVWFPAVVDLSYRTFSSSANFILATFSSDSDFISATFSSDAYFSSATFSSKAYFISATFSSDASFTLATFSSDASFISATFSSDAYFSSATFSAEIHFEQVKFSKTSRTDFHKTKFENDTFFDRARFRNDVSFKSAIFGKESDVFFRRAFFAGNADFGYCTAEGYLTFEKLRIGNEVPMDFQKANFEKASRISFHTVRLQPNWFVNIDSRKFVFTDIDWENIDWKQKRNFRKKLKFAANCAKSGWRQFFGKTDETVCENIAAELERLEKRGITDQKKRLLEIACRQLAVNAEENNRYEEASRFRYMAMETRRLEYKGVWRFLNLHWFYKWSSGYGESWSRAAVVLLGVLFLFGALYVAPFANFDFGEKKREIVADPIEQRIFDTAARGGRFRDMTWDEGFVHSLYVAALQRPEPKSEGTLTKFFVIMETIFAPLQAALLALAIRRKFMR